MCIRHGLVRSNSTSAALHRLHERTLPLLHDTLSPTNAQLLHLTLSPYLGFQKKTNDFSDGAHLRPGYHLVYFPERVAESQLASDGYSTLQSPGGDFCRRMWAGGRVDFHAPLAFGRSALCEEKIVRTEVKGSGMEEKIFVWTQRAMRHVASARPNVIEERCIVYMRERTYAPLARTLRHVSVEICPSSLLLHRFSALTFNAHKIHYDPAYAREVERYEAPLVHGPLSLVFMLELLRLEVGPVRTLEYRNLAPLYVDRPFRVCLRPLESRKYETWIETRDGGYAVRGTAILGDQQSHV